MNEKTTIYQFEDGIRAMELKSWIFCWNYFLLNQTMTFGHNSWRCILPNGKNFLTLKCTHCNKTGHTKSRCFEIVGYPDWWDHNCDQRKKDSKKTSTAVVAEIKIEANVAEKASALVAATDYGGKF